MSPVTILLSIMMFLQFFIWGSWYVTAPNYLGTIGFTGPDFGWTYAVGPIAGLVTPLLVGMVADRFFSAQRVLAILHMIGAGMMYLATTQMQVQSPSPKTINLIFLGYMLAYYPTLALTNTIALRNMTNSELEFPRIRVFGTIGWILAGIFLTAFGIETKINMFYVTIAASFALGLFSLMLPNTPPVATGKVSAGELLGLDALKLLKDRSYLVFMISSMLICIPLAFYYQIASRIVEMAGMKIGLTMSYGQMSEIFFMLVMPFFFARLGVKWMLLVGMLAWVTRYTLFAFGASDNIAWMIIAGIVLHGICYDFFFVTGQIYTDQKAPKPIRAQAQGLLVMLTLGVGMMIGAKVAGEIEGAHTTPKSKELAAQVTAKADELKALTATPNYDEAAAKKLTAEKDELRRAELRAIEWKPLWGKPAIFAAAVMIFFGLFFHDKVGKQVTEGEVAEAAAREELV
ncbi:MFS transporter [Planctomicrobium sp. SH664]|uniref:MFS transporter n=1 Tax=Planctomicrobium sp. SH664 TaxID=3448125 RepID=UPI003F5BE26A